MPFKIILPPFFNNEKLFLKNFHFSMICILISSKFNINNLNLEYTANIKEPNETKMHLSGIIIYVNRTYSRELCDPAQRSWSVNHWK